MSIGHTMPRPVKYISVMLLAIASGTWGYLRYCSECRPAAPGQAVSAVQAAFLEEGACALFEETGCARASEPGIAPDPALSLNQEIPTLFR